MSESQNIELRYVAPEGRLESMITSYYDLRFHGSLFTQSERADNPQVRFQLSGEGYYTFRDGRTLTAYPVTIIGPTSGPRDAEATGPLYVTGFGLMPAGWAALVKEDGYDWLDDGFDARELLGDAVMQVWRQMRDAGSFEERLKITQAYAEALFPELDEAPDQFVRAVNAWLMASGSPDVDTLVAATGLSARQVERLTKRYYGLPPKQLARKYRALRAAGMIATGEAFDSSELANAFYDQSHLTRELKQFTGLTPGQLKKRPPELLSLTMRARKAMRKKISPLISDT